MRIAIAYTSKGTDAAEAADAALSRVDVPDDLEEEFDSPATVAAVAAALEGLGHEVELLGDGPRAMRRLLDGSRPDLVFNFAEGRGVSRSREAWMPAVLEMLGIPFTGSDPLTLAVTLDKEVAKRLVSTAGVLTPRWQLLRSDDAAELAPDLELPVIVKPVHEGSSKGVRRTSLIERREDFAGTVDQLRRWYRQDLLVEEFIDGEELTVGVVGNDPPRVLAIMRVVPVVKGGPFIYGLEVKRDWRRQLRYECPAQLPPAVTRTIEEATLSAWRALGCRDVSRFDFRLRGDRPYFLEVNPLPGLSPDHGDLVILTRAIGIEYEDLIAQIVETAVSRSVPSVPAAE